jgi:hypothetical protein
LKKQVKKGINTFEGQSPIHGESTQNKRFNIQYPITRERKDKKSRMNKKEYEATDTQIIGYWIFRVGYWILKKQAKKGINTFEGQSPIHGESTQNKRFNIQYPISSTQ